MGNDDDRRRVRVLRQISLKHREAGKQYDALCIKDTLAMATVGLGDGLRTKLVDDAMALCGSPYHEVSATPWNEEQWEFLALFCELVPEKAEV